MPEREIQTKMFIEAGEASWLAAEHIEKTAAIMENLVKVIGSYKPTAIMTCARGSSDHAATYAKYMFEKYLGLPVVSHAPSMSSVYCRPLYMKNTLFITISQSGESPDLIKSAVLARKQGALTVAIVNQTSSPLAKSCDYILPLCAGPEISVAATKSYILSLVAIANLTGQLSQDKTLIAAMKLLPKKLSQAWDLNWSPLINILENARNFFVIGRGFSFGIAQEAALKFKETSGLHAEAYSAAEVKHGPMALIKKDFPVLMFVANDELAGSFDKAAKDFIENGATVIVVGKSYEGAIALPTVENSHPELAVICMIQSFYRMVNKLSLIRGYDPDLPPSLKKVTATL